MPDNLANFEEWKPVYGYPHYLVSSRGKLFNQITNQFVNGYQSHHTHPPRVTLSMNGKIRSFFLHRLVAQAFFDNFEPNKDVEFIDGDNTNADVLNLRFKGSNTRSRYFSGDRYFRSRWLVATNYRTGETRHYRNVRDAVEALDVDASGIYLCVQGRRAHTGGWRFAWEMAQTDLRSGEPVWLGG